MDGTIEYVGRRDAQVKVRGQRVELGAIEDEIRRALPKAKQVVVDMSRREGRETLVAFLTFKSRPDKAAGLSSGILPMGDKLRLKIIWAR